MKINKHYRRLKKKTGINKEEYILHHDRILGDVIIVFLTISWLLIILYGFISLPQQYSNKNKAKQNSRFSLEAQDYQATLPYDCQGIYTITDKQTGVQYLVIAQEEAYGITVLVDEDGKPVTVKKEGE